MILNVETVALSKSQKTFVVKAGGKSYLAKKDSKIELANGKTIEAEVAESVMDDGAKLYWINEWAIVPAGVPTGEYKTTTTSPAPAPTNGDRWYMAFVSNTVAHAIQSGLITEPIGIKAWAAAAKQAAMEL